jgi:hypothetical protein
MLADEGYSTNIYARHMFAPFKWVHSVLFEPILQVRPFDVCLLLLLGWAMTKKRAKRPLVRPMRRALLVAAATIAVEVAYGMARGGDARAAGWQVYLLFSLILASFTFAMVFETAEQFAAVLRTVVFAGAYHAVMAILFYLFYVIPGAVSVAATGDYLTTHDDTVLWTLGVGYLAIRLFETPTPRMRVIAGVGIPLFLLAIQLNHRRLAWITLGGVLLILYFLVARSRVKRRIRRIASVAVPVVALYAIVGWERPEGIFRPLQAFASISSEKDASTKARNVENLGLIATANQGWLLGTGFGHKYVEVSSKYQIYFFELWPYVPHNSVLGFFAYTGFLGFLGYWMTIPIATFLHARTARLGDKPAERLVGVVGVMQVVACANQWYGDMGAFSSITDYTLATCFAAALRVPLAAHAWAEGRGAPRAPAPEPEAA